MNKFKLILFASNEDGSKIFSRMTCDGKNIFKGYYDFNRDRFFVTKYFKDNRPQDMSKAKLYFKLKEILITERDWELWETHLKKFTR